MDTILYYSVYCENCKKILGIIGRTPLKDRMHFICIDKRKCVEGRNCAVLENGKEVMLPPNLHSVPSLLLLNRGYRLLTGDDIIEFVTPKIEKDKLSATGSAGEPMAYSFSGGGDIASDSFSYLDQTVEDMGAKGNGGIKQLHHYARLGDNCAIDTPPDSEGSQSKEENTTYSTSV